jgi:hypothetical protein
MTTPDRIFAAEQALRGDLDGWLHDHTEQEGDCLIWQGGSNDKGRRPIMRLPSAFPKSPTHKPRTMPTRRVVYEQYHGVSVPSDMYVWNKNTCGDIRCIRPDHLICTTRAVMLASMAKAGRLEMNEIHRMKVAENSRRRSPLTWEIVEEIRRVMDGIPANRSGKPGSARSDMYMRLSEQFGVDYRTVMDVANRRRWVRPQFAANNPFAQLLMAA